MENEYPTLEEMNIKGNIEPPKKTFFFQRKNGSVFATHEKEAWNLVRQDIFTLIGVSDGKKFQQAVLEAKRIYETTGDLPQAQERLRLGEKEELESARGNMEMPRDFSRLDNTGKPTTFRRI